MARTPLLPGRRLTWVGGLLASLLVATTLVTVPADPALAAPPANIELSTSRAVLSAGQVTTLTALTDVAVQGSSSVMTINDQTTGTVLATCTIGRKCVATTPLTSGRAHTFTAQVNDLVSKPVGVERRAWTVSLAAASGPVTAGAAAQLVATANQNVGLSSTSLAIHVFDKTQGTLLATCTVGKVCKARTSEFSTGPAHEYVAAIAEPGKPAVLEELLTPQAVSGVVMVETLPWTIDLTTDHSSLLAGEQAVVTASTNQDVGDTGGAYAIHIFEILTGERVQSCETGLTCSFVHSSTGNEYSEYVAVVGASGEPADLEGVADKQAQSGPVSVSSADWALSFSRLDTEVEPGVAAQFRIEWAHSLSETEGKYVVYWFDADSLERMGSCTTGTACTVTALEGEDGQSGAYFAAVAAPTTPSNYNDVIDLLATSGTVAADGYWALSLEINPRDEWELGSAVLTARANHSLLSGVGDYAIYFFDAETGERTYGESCVPMECSFSANFDFDRAHEFFAAIASPTDPASFSEAQSVQVVTAPISIPAVDWTVSIAASTNVRAVGETVTFTATAVAEPGPPQDFALSIYDSTTGLRLKTCSWSTTCRYSIHSGSNSRWFGFESGPPHAVVAVVTRSVAPPASFTDLPETSRVSEPGTVTRAPWSLTVESTNSQISGSGENRVLTTLYSLVPNQDSDREHYSAFLVDTTTGRVAGSRVSNNPLCDGICYSVSEMLNSPPHSFRAYVAYRHSSGPVEYSDVQAKSASVIPDAGAAILSSEMIGGENPAEKDCTCDSADPINTATGEFFLPETDLGIPGGGPALEISRTYSSVNAAMDGPFGFGWASGLSTRLDILVAADAGSTHPKQVQITQENGSTVVFNSVEGGEYEAPARVIATLSHDADGQWQFTRRSSETLVFNGGGVLTSVSDIHGNSVVFAHNSLNQVVNVSASGGRSINLAWNGGRVAELTDSAGRSVSYGYDTSGNLTSAIGVDGSVTAYGYNLAHFMTNVTAPGGGVTTNVYNSAKRVSQQTDPVGRVTSFTYSGGVTTVTAPNGSKTAEVYANNRLVSRTAAAGSSIEATTHYQYDAASNVTSITDALGHETTFDYDADGNMLKKTEALGYVTSWTYNSLSKPLTVTNPLGQTQSFAYDPVGSLVGSTTHSGKEQSWTFNSDGSVASSTSASGAVSVYAYDAAGRLATATDAGGRTTSLVYNAAGVVSQQVEPGGSTTTIVPDPAGRPQSTTDAVGRMTTYGYDAAGNPNAVTDPNGNSTFAVYNLAGELVSTTDANGKISQYTYTPSGQLATVRDPLNRVWTTSYDELSRPTSTTDPLGRVSTATYDVGGRQLTAVQPSGSTTSMLYDASGRPTATTDALGNTSYSTYNAANQVVNMTDALGRETTSTYNQDGLPSTLVLPDQSEVTYAYNDDAQITSFTNADGKVTSYIYDAAGLLASKTEPGGLTTAITYDAAGRPSVVTLPDGTATTYGYDAAGRQISVDYSSTTQVDTVLAYDPAGQLTALTDSTGTTSFTYDPAGNLLSEIDGSADEISYAFDSAGQLTTITYPGDLDVDYGYDLAGQMTSVTDWLDNTSTFTWTPNGQLAGAAAANGVAQSNTYDAANQLTSISDALSNELLASFGYSYGATGLITGATTTLDGSTVENDYGYDAINQLDSVGLTPSGGTPSSSTLGATSAGLLTTTVAGDTLTYNAAQQVTDLLSVGGASVSFLYNDRGSRTSSTVAANGLAAAATTEYEYTAAGALASVASPTAAVLYTSDARGLRQSRTEGSDADDFLWSTLGGLPLLLDDGDHRYIYGPSSAPLAQVDRHSGTVEYLHTDLLGTPRLITDAAGAVAGTTTFDSFGTRTAHTGLADSAFGFTGNWSDPTTGLLYLRARDYDPVTGQFLSVDPAVERTRQPYAYTGNNPVLLTDPTGLDAWSDFGAELGAFGLGALDGVTMGLSSAVLSAVDPGYECFIQQHNTAFQVGSVAAQVVSAAVMIVGTAGAGTGLVVGMVAARVAIKVAVKTAVAAARKTVTRAATAGVKTVTSATARVAARSGDDATVTLYRGLNSDHHAYADGLQGVARPGNPLGHSDGALHNAGDTMNSRLTSWSTDKSVAADFMMSGAGNEGVILVTTIKQQAGRMVASPDAFNELEVLLSGIVRGTRVIERTW